MESLTEQKCTAFVDRRTPSPTDGSEGLERRQFRDSQSEARPEVVELGEAIDRYKLRHRRRFITFDELFDVISELGYHK